VQDLVFLLEAFVFASEPLHLRLLGLALGQRLSRSGCEMLGAPRAELASASADPAARCSVRHVLSWPVLSPSSVATSETLRPPSTRLTACALNSGVNRRRMRLSAVASSWSSGVL